MAGIPKDILPVGLLMKEHRLIDKMVAVVDKKVAAYRGSGKPSVEFIDAVIDFFSVYADENHHGKEEKILFERLAQRDMTAEDRTTMEALLSDHVSGRKIIRRLRELKGALIVNNPEAIDETIDQLQALVSLYSQHVDREDNHFFLPVMRYFNKSEQEQMIEDFVEFDTSMIHDHYRKIVTMCSERQD